MSSPNAIEQAKKEIAEERFRQEVEKEKQRLREYRSVFDRLFPYTIKIERK